MADPDEGVFVRTDCPFCRHRNVHQFFGGGPSPTARLTGKCDKCGRTIGERPTVLRPEEVGHRCPTCGVVTAEKPNIEEACQSCGSYERLTFGMLR